jgi:hypothetical protein
MTILKTFYHFRRITKMYVRIRKSLYGSRYCPDERVDVLAVSGVDGFGGVGALDGVTGVIGVGGFGGVGALDGVTGVGGALGAGIV